MKGIIFTEFVEMVEDEFGYEVSDRMINDSYLPSGGVYTAVGTYEFDEMVELLSHLSKQTGLSSSELLYAFGTYLFGRFNALYPHFFNGKDSAFEFLSKIHNYIHVEVLKLYPDAQLPEIKTEIFDEGQKMKMVYKSSRKLSDLALGLINGCIDYFNEDIIVEKVEAIEGGSEVSILLTKNRSL